MTFPTPFTVGVHTYSAGSDDGYGNPVPVYTPARDQPGTEYAVCGWVTSAPPVEERGGQDRVIIDLQLFAPATFPATAYDLVDVEDTQFEVIGEAEDYNNGPWWMPGVAVWNLRNVTG